MSEFETTRSYADGAREQIEWYDAHPDQQQVDEGLDAVFDRLVRHARSAAT